MSGRRIDLWMPGGYKMEFNLDRLNKEFSHMRSIGSKEPVINIVKDLLKNKKVEEEDQFVVEGLWAYEKMIDSNIKIKAFVFCIDFITSPSLLQMVRFFIKRAEKSYRISSSLCSRLSGRDSSEGFFLLCSLPKFEFNHLELRRNNLLVVLDGLEKPGNIGTIIRSVDAAGGDGIVLCSKVRKTNQKLIKSSMGSSFHLPVIESDIHETISWLKENDFKIIVTDLMATKSYYNIDYKGRVAIIAGNEIRGISDQWREQKCERVIIPMFGRADSLNVGVAAALVVYEASCRQKNILRNITG
jgi:RNA methyltransferase, TrmH family